MINLTHLLLLFLIFFSLYAKATPRIKRDSQTKTHKASTSLAVPKEGEIVPIVIHESQFTTNAIGTIEYKATLIDYSPYEAVRIGEYLWMNRNLSDSIPHVYAAPWDPGGGWVGESCMMDVNQYYLDRDMDRLFIDKSQFQIDMKDFHKYYGRYYSRFETWHFQRKAGEPYIYNGDNLKVYEGKDLVRTAWRLPFNADYRQLFAMCPVGANNSLGQVAVRIALSARRNDNPLAYDIYDPKGGMNYRTYWFDMSTNSLGFNMMPGGSRLNGDGWIDNGYGPVGGKWPGIKGDIYHLFHTATYATVESQVGIHDNISSGLGMSYHWYNVRFCRELTAEELGYKLYINKENYSEDYDYVIQNLDRKTVDIIKLPYTKEAPSGYYELPKGYLRGFYVQYILNKRYPKSVEQIVEYMKRVDDDLFYSPTGEKYVPDPNDILEDPVVEGESFMVYPNPVESVLHVDTYEDDPIKSLELYSLRGQKVMIMNTFDIQNSIDVSLLPQGVYILLVRSAKDRLSMKIMKK